MAKKSKQMMKLLSNYVPLHKVAVHAENPKPQKIGEAVMIMGLTEQQAEIFLNNIYQVLDRRELVYFMVKLPNGYFIIIDKLSLVELAHVSQVLEEQERGPNADNG